jgi:hypothetical protein
MVWLLSVSILSIKVLAICKRTISCVLHGLLDCAAVGATGWYQILSVARIALLKVYLRYCVSNVRAYLTLFTHTDIL